MTVSDKKIQVNNSGEVGYYTADVKSASDYAPFGSQLVGRKWNAGDYRYGFNGKENDNEVKGEGNQQDYGMRISDPRLGRFLSVDPLTKDYPWYTPYQFAGNMPIAAVDVDGEEPDMKTMAKASAKQAQLEVQSAEHNQRQNEMAAKPWLRPYDPEILIADVYGNGHIGRQSYVEPKVARINNEYNEAVGQNISGGVFGAVGYLVAGDQGSFKGAALDQTITALAVLPPVKSSTTTNTKKAATIANGGKAPSGSYATQEPLPNITAAKKLQVGEYATMTKANVKSGLAADHIPSFAAMKSFTEQNLGRKLTPTEAVELRKTTLTMVYEASIHQTTSRTFGGRNNLIQIALDAANLGSAIEKDIKALTPKLLKAGYSQADINAAQKQLAEKHLPK